MCLPFGFMRLGLMTLFRLLALLWLLLPGASWAQDHILEKAFWTDASGGASFEQARAASYTPYTGVLSKGFSRDAQWIKLTIAGVPPGGSDSLVVRIRPVFLDEITLYDPVDLARGQAARTTGDTTPLASAEFESLNYAFVIPAQSTPRDIWLRLSTTSTQLMHVEVLTPREMLRQEHSLWLVYSALLALILSFLVWVLLAWLRDRDPDDGHIRHRQCGDGQDGDGQSEQQRLQPNRQHQPEKLHLAHIGQWYGGNHHASTGECAGHARSCIGWNRSQYRLDPSGQHAQFECAHFACRSSADAGCARDGVLPGGQQGRCPHQDGHHLPGLNRHLP